MAETFNEQSMIAALKVAIEHEVNRAVEQATQEVLERTRIAVREKLGALACGLLKEYTVYGRGQEIVITVKRRDDLEN